MNYWAPCTQIIFSLVMMSIWYHQAKHLETNAEQLTAAALLFMMVTLPTFGAAGYMPSIVLERPVFYRELDDGCYPVVAYVLYKIFEETVLAASVGLLVTIIVYFGCSLGGNFGIFYFGYFMVLQSGIALAYLVSAVAPHMDAANALLPTYSVIMLFFTGILIRRQDIPPAWRWYSYTLFGRFGWELMMLNQFGEDFQPAGFGDDGPDVLSYYDVYGTVGQKCVILILIWLCWILLAMVALKFVRHQKR
eukprot:scaffold4595_cov415-Prasinococcus_capsulatus_cf.AAC.4